MLRDPSLVPLSHQHQHGLALCVLVERALREDSGPERAAEHARTIMERFGSEIANHFAVEENVLFPALAALPLVTELLQEHREMERQVEALRRAPAADRIMEFTSLLRRHIRREEGELFEQAQRILPREVLDALGREIDARVVRVCL
ncbi:MAG: hemerythrin domain-containing protein [Bryobacteraceae bacterium]